MARIFDNIKLDLGSHLSQTLQVSDQVDAAVGYFNLRGWAMFDAIVRAKAAGNAQQQRRRSHPAAGV